MKNSKPDCRVTCAVSTSVENSTSGSQHLFTHRQTFRSRNLRRVKRPKAARIYNLRSEKKAYRLRAVRARWILCASARGSSHSSLLQFLAWRQQQPRTPSRSNSRWARAPSPTRRRKRYHWDQSNLAVHNSNMRTRSYLQLRVEAQRPPT